MEKTLQQIKDEYAGERGRDSWDELFSWNELAHTGIDRMQYHHDQVAIRYAQEQKRELVEMLESVVKLQKDHYGNGSRTHIALILKAKEIDKLITKHK